MLDKVQIIQEEEYLYPYHYGIKRESRLGRFYFSFVDLLKTIIEKSNTDKYLDIGCGDARLINLLDKKKIHPNKIFGIDYSKRAIDFAKILNPEITFFSCSLLDLNESNFDLITNINVFEHIPPNEHDIF